MYWSCPDHAALSRALQSDVLAVNHFFISVSSPLILPRILRCGFSMPCQSRQSSASPQRGNPRWHSVSPAQTEVFIAEDGDVALRASGQYLGSFARNWIIPLGFHPFQFGLAPQMPRFRCGRVIVQRRSLDRAPVRNSAAGISPAFRANWCSPLKDCAPPKDWPRFVYIRPTEQALASQRRRRPRQGYQAGLYRSRKLSCSWKFFIAG